MCWCIKIQYRNHGENQVTKKALCSLAQLGFFQASV